MKKNTEETAKKTGRPILFKVAAISANTNSFGLSQYIFVSRNGTALKACGYKPLRDEQKGSVVLLGEPFETSLSKRNFELPEIIGTPPPPALIKEVWGNAVPVLLAKDEGDFVKVILFSSREAMQAEAGKSWEHEAALLPGCKDLGAMPLARARKIADDNGIEMFPGDAPAG